MGKERPFLKSLRGKVVLQMLIVSLLPILIVGGLVWNSMSNAESSASDSVDASRSALEQDTVGTNKADLAWILSYDMEKWIADRIKDVESWASSPALISAARASADTDRSAYQYLGEEMAGITSFQYGYLTDLSGNIIADYNPNMVKLDTQSSEATWKQVGDYSNLHVAEARLASGIEPPYVIDITVRVNEIGSGDQLGILVGGIKVHPLTIAGEYEAKVHGNRVMMWDRTGRIIADSGNSKRYIQNSEELNWTAAETRVVNSIPNDASVIDPAIHHTYIINDDVVAGYARAGNSSIDVDIPGFDGLGWMVMVEQEADTAFAALESLKDLENDLEDNTQNMLITLAIILLIVIVVVPVIAYYFSRSITKPIAYLSDAAEKVSMGDMSVTVQHKSDDEIGDLADSFGRMVTAVRFLSEEDEEE